MSVHLYLFIYLFVCWFVCLVSLLLLHVLILALFQRYIVSFIPCCVAIH